MPVSEIETADYNPRVQLKPGDAEWDRLAAIIDEYGLVEPLVWNARTKRLVGGHQRLAILKHRGDETVSVSVVDLDEEREKALNLALNNPSAQSTWDPMKLVQMAENMTAEAIRVAGFDTMGDVHEIVRRAELSRSGGFLGEFLSDEARAAAGGPQLPTVPAQPSDGEDDDADEEAEPANDRPVETDLKEPHKHLAGEQYFETKLVFDGPQRDIWLRFQNRLKEERDTDNTFEALIAHASDYLAKGDRDRIDEGVDTL
jgi:hypothetical protein